jgi:hypothetical protein
MSTKPVRINDATTKAGIAKGDMKLEVLIIPISDVDRAQEMFFCVGEGGLHAVGRCMQI